MRPSALAAATTSLSPSENTMGELVNGVFPGVTRPLGASVFASSATIASEDVFSEYVPSPVATYTVPSGPRAGPPPTTLPPCVSQRATFVDTGAAFGAVGNAPRPAAGSGVRSIAYTPFGTPPQLSAVATYMML